MVVIVRMAMVVATNAQQMIVIMVVVATAVRMSVPPSAATAMRMPVTAAPVRVTVAVLECIDAD